MNGDTPQKPEDSNWQFHAENTQTPQAQGAPGSSSEQLAPDILPPHDDLHEVTWSASEYVAHEKTALWYLALFGGVVVLVAVIYFITKDMTAVVLIGLIAILFAILAARKPRVLEYNVGPQGITIGHHLYSYHDFKSFGVVTQGAFSSIVLVPLKRFMPSLTVYYPPEDENRIVDALSNYLPFAPVTPDLLDRTMFRIRF